MGCRSSTAAAEPEKAAAESHLPSEDGAQPSAAKVPSADGSDTSTDDASSSLQMSAETAETSMDSNELRTGHVESMEDFGGPGKEFSSAGSGNLESDIDAVRQRIDDFNAAQRSSNSPCKSPDAICVDSDLSGTEEFHHTPHTGPCLSSASDVVTLGSGRRDEAGVFFEIAGSDAGCAPGISADSKETLSPYNVNDKLVDGSAAVAKPVRQVPRRQVSCLSGTSARDPSRKVSFHEGGPEVVHIEPVVNFEPGIMGTLRRANAISSVDIAMDGDYPELESVFELDDGGDPPRSAPAAFSALSLEPPRHAGCFSTFGLCCVSRVDGGMPSLQGPADYGTDQSEGDEICLPYASHVQEAAFPTTSPIASPVYDRQTYI